LYTAGLSSLLGYGIFNSLLARNPSSAVVPWILLVPPVAIVSAWVLLDERPNGAELIGGAVLVAGVLVATALASSTSRPAWPIPSADDEPDWPGSAHLPAGAAHAEGPS
jgi:O-acetylserine/cysteine efflux transporter